MTLVAFHADGNSADLITDTSVYLPAGTGLGHTTKAQPLHHLDAVVTGQGSRIFDMVVRMQASLLAEMSPTFDLFTRGAPDMARDAWAITRAKLAGREPCDSAMFVIGYSTEAGRFVAHAYASEDGFTPRPIEGLFCIPSPTSVRPSNLELARLDGTLNPADMDYLRSRPAPAVPRSRQQWVSLAQDVRRQRALQLRPLKVFVTGTVHHTTVKRGEIRTKAVHTFNDSGAEFQQLVAGTCHPMSQAGACTCGSGRRYADCCMAPYLDEPCPCGESAKSLRDCCYLDVREKATA